MFKLTATGKPSLALATWDLPDSSLGSRVSHTTGLHPADFPSLWGLLSSLPLGAHRWYLSALHVELLQIIQSLAEALIISSLLDSPHKSNSSSPHKPLIYPQSFSRSDWPFKLSIFPGLEHTLCWDCSVSFTSESQYLQLSLAVEHVDSHPGLMFTHQWVIVFLFFSFFSAFILWRQTLYPA